MNQRAKLGELLVGAGVIDAAQLQSALGEQRKWGRPLGVTLVQLGFLDEDTLLETLAHQLKLPVVKLAGKRVSPEVLRRIPRDVAEEQRCIPLVLNDEGGQQVLYLGLEDPYDLEAIDEIGFRLGLKVKPVLVAPTELSEAIERHYGDAPEADEAPEFVEVPPADPRTALSAAAPARDGDGAAFAGGVPPSVLLRALSQLLVDKGVIGRDEFVARVQALMRGDDAGG